MCRNPGSNSRVLLSATCVLALFVLGTTAAAETHVNRMKLRPAVTVDRLPIMIADVVAFVDADAALIDKLGDERVTDDARGAAHLTITHEAIVKRLEALGVSPASVLVEGAAACEISLTQAAKPAPNGSARKAATPVEKTSPAPRAKEDVVLAVDEQPLDSDVAATRSSDGRSLADEIRALVNRDLAPLGGTGEVAFERAGREFLDLTTPPFEFAVHALGREKLGMREFRVSVRRDGHLQRAVTVAARVRLVREVVVAKRPLSLGNFIREGDVALEPRVFDDDDRLGLEAVEKAIGRQVTKFVPEGEMLPADGVKAVDLVQRSRPITVLSQSGGVQMRLSGIALDAGSYGETVRIRLGEGRGARQQAQGVVVATNTVRLVEGQP